MAMTKLGDKAAGSTIKIKVNGTAREWIVVHQGRPSTLYDTSCDGTLNSGGSGLSCELFLLSFREIGGTVETYANGANDGAALNYFNGTAKVDSKRIGYLSGTATIQFLRSPSKSGTTISTNAILSVSTTGGFANGYKAKTSYGIRPAMILPKDMMVSDDGTVSANTAPTTPPSLSVPSQINGGSTITIEWGAASDAESNLEGYELQRSLDGGSTWANVYLGSARSTTNTVPFGTETVMYRVRAYDSAGLYSAYRTGSSVTVINNTAPSVPDGITVPEQVQGGQPLTITWGGSVDDQGNLAGYSLERSVNGGAWEVVYSGPERGFTDFITKGWLTVDYRVRAYDSANAYSGFAAAGGRAVNNNTPAVITSEHPANVSLGVKSEGFTVGYIVKDEEGDGVTVTESVDGAALRTFAVELGKPNTLTLGGVDFMRLLNGNHTLAIAANDGSTSAVYQLPFTKLVTAASVTLERPMVADGPISVCVLSVSGSIPVDAALSVQATNNALDAAPVWEDCTAAIYAGIELGGSHYSLTEHDQTEIMAQYTAVKEDAAQVFYHADGELCRTYPAEEFAALAQAATAHVFYHRTYCSHLNTWIKRAELEELAGITYGAALPEDLAQSMEAIISAAVGSGALRTGEA